ncbi:uncharacterized protein LOC128961189 [Oppia nitens]|uniref:uncharacterized protein LOC128961189 n=1 Tax=Oppia nitens TaxID=1686743 RepID=UPI0023DC68DA|nr:uncharacterized protein LOC128961189 [Oppia nitens]
MTDNDCLNDDTLRYELESRGQSVGPIVDSTRELYIRLLKRLMTEEMDKLMADSDDQLDRELQRNASPTTSADNSSGQRTNNWSLKTKLLSILVAIVLAYLLAKYFNNK